MYLRYFTILIALSAFILFYQSFSFARPFRVNQVPNGTVSQCITCHAVAEPSPGNGPRNDFGSIIESRFLTEPNSSGNVIWGPALASLDADDDGVINGEELQDPFGSWESGQGQPGNASLVTRPGDPTSNQITNLHIQFSGMTPHVGQQLEIRVVDKSTELEAGREEVSAIPSANFLVDLPVLLPGHSYWIDMYADFNQNSLYDAPPVDHAWRLSLDNATGNDTVNFAHNTQFTDIGWVYALTVRFNDMTPHVGQLLELRVVEQSTMHEIARKRIEAISTADFDVEMPGLKLGQNYSVDFYADLNGNFLYDAPSTDHAWRETFTAQERDVRLDFTHNTSFTDIGWNYLFNLNLAEMNPHVGQKFELRLIDEASGTEVGRVSLDSILVPDFVVSIPGLLTGNDYRADFYADLNRNGSYDAPPTDHAWRISFSATGGNIVENFTHNTSFTNIEWPTAILFEPISEIPKSFTLGQNYPNPFNPQTRISFNVRKNSHVKIEVFNALGEKVQEPVNEFLAAGNYEVVWDGTNTVGQKVSTGMYLYKMTTSDFSQVKRMILMK